MFSEVAIRKRLTMKYKDPYHQEDMAKIIYVQVQFLTDTRVIAEFMESMEILGKKYAWKTYTSPYDGIVDILNAQQGLVNTLNPGQKAINEQRMTYVETASVTEASDHVFGEQVKNPGDPKLDPRVLSAQQWFAKDWKLVHKHRAPVVRQTQTGTSINDRRVKPLILCKKSICNR